MISTKKLIYKILQCPQVVAQGTTTTFIYRKWSDGTSECWGNIGIANTSTGVYSGNFPGGLFIDRPTVSVTNWYGEPSDANRGARNCIVTDGSSATQLNVYFRKADGTNYTGYFGISIYAIGRWK